MQQPRSTLILTRTVAYIVLCYGLVIVMTPLFRQLRAHHGTDLDALFVTVRQVIGLGFAYLGTLLMRRKYNAWVAALVLFGVSLLLNVVRLGVARDIDSRAQVVSFALPLLIVVLLLLTRSAFQVRSDARSFVRAARVSLLVLAIAFVYGVSGFMLLDRHDFRRDITPLEAVHQTIDQFGLTTHHPVAHTRRARIFMDSLPVISIAALAYVAVSLFDPIRMRFVNAPAQRARAEKLLREYPSDIDDFFKLWPHDKLYYFDKTGEAGLAYRVSQGVALVAGDPFGNPKRFLMLCRSFQELCFVNDWRPAFVHVRGKHRRLYEKLGLQLQKIGEEAVVDLDAFMELRGDKYFRQIRNRFTKQGYAVELLEPPYSAELLTSLQAISQDWLARPGRAERGFMMGYHTDEYLQQGLVALARDSAGAVLGFMNVVPTFEPGLANYDMLRCKADAPGNCSDFLLLGVIDILHARGYTTLNLGLSPLKGLDEASETTGVIDAALRFIYANGDRFYSFNGLQRFKAKYHPAWEARYIAYAGNAATFARIMRALAQAMKVK